MRQPAIGLAADQRHAGRHQKLIIDVQAVWRHWVGDQHFLRKLLRLDMARIGERMAAGDDEHLFIGVVPQMSKDGSAAREARERLAAMLDRLHGAGLLASGMIGDPDPYTATVNALELFTVDDVVISTLPDEKSGWLRADLDLTTKLLKDGKVLAWSLAAWQTDIHLSSVRAPASLAKLPAAEREEWQRLWADVAAAVSAEPLEEGRAYAARRDWYHAADCYAPIESNGLML